MLNTHLLKQDGIDYILINIHELDRVRDKFQDSLSLSNGEIIKEFQSHCELVLTDSSGKVLLYKL